jgi:hypothetical protein
MLCSVPSRKLDLVDFSVSCSQPRHPQMADRQTWQAKLDELLRDVA